MKDVDNTKQPCSTLSICTGSHGLERGIEQAIGRDLRISAFVEIEAFVIENMVKQMESGLLDPAPVWLDARTFPAEQFHGKLHLITGGYPCQGESNAGKRRLWNDPRFLWPHFERIIKATNPVCGFFENVDGHLSGTFQYVLASLRDMGYAVEVGIFGAEQVVRGQREEFALESSEIVSRYVERRIPHKRNRVFILALDYTYLQRCPSERGVLSPRGNGPEYSGASKELADSDSVRHSHGKSKQHPAERGEHAFRDPSASGDEAMADTEIERVQRVGAEGKQVTRPHDGEGISMRFGRGTSVARPGWPQHRWEHPRAIEPKLGSSVNGYNYREDLLRLYGNAVVPDAAELAYRTLWKQMSKNLGWTEN